MPLAEAGTAAQAAGYPKVGDPTILKTPSIGEMHRGHQLMKVGKVLPRPGLIANVPTVTDSSLAPAGHHILSLEALYTPYGLPGGWPDSAEPKRWLDLFGTLVQAEWRDSIVDWRAMTPDRYEREFHLPHGHATSFAGGPLAAFVKLQLLNREARDFREAWKLTREEGRRWDAEPLLELRLKADQGGLEVLHAAYAAGRDPVPSVVVGDDAGG